jgi:SAM-dependent methyltransferase
MKKKLEFVYVRDQEPLSDEEYQLAVQIGTSIRRLIEQRPEYVRTHGLNPDVYLPMANWSLDSDVHAGCRLLLSGRRDTIARLRLFSQSFSGFRLMDMHIARGTAIPDDVPDTLDDALERIAATPDHWAKRYLATARKLPAFIAATPPRKFGELGWDYKGRIMSHDSYACLERLGLLFEAGFLDPAHSLSLRGRSPLRILEIGAGFGGLAHEIRKLLPQAHYTIVDLPESLIFSATYLSILHRTEPHRLVVPEDDDATLSATAPGFSFVPNYLFPRLSRAACTFDLVLNTLSMSEMSDAQVRDYCVGIRELLGETGVFFEQNQDNRHLHLLNASDIIREYFPATRTLTGCFLRKGPAHGAPHLWSPWPGFQFSQPADPLRSTEDRQPADGRRRPGAGHAG